MKLKLNLTIFTIAALIAPALAFADEADDHLQKGTRFYNVGEWESALKEYKQSYTLDPKPETLWAIAQTQRQSGDCRSAILTYRAYLRGASAAGANSAEEWIKKCEADLDAQQRAIDAVVVVPPKPVTAPVVKPAEPRSRFRDPLGDGLLVLGVGGVVTGTVVLLLGNSDMNASTSKPTYALYDQAVASAHTKQQIGYLTAAGGAVFVGLAVWRFMAVGGNETGEARHAFAPVIIPGGAMFAYDTRF